MDLFSDFSETSQFSVLVLTVERDRNFCLFLRKAVKFRNNPLEYATLTGMHGLSIKAWILLGTLFSAVDFLLQVLWVGLVTKRVTRKNTNYLCSTFIPCPNFCYGSCLFLLNALSPLFSVSIPLFCFNLSVLDLNIRPILIATWFIIQSFKHSGKNILLSTNYCSFNAIQSCCFFVRHYMLTIS